MSSTTLSPPSAQTLVGSGEQTRWGWPQTLATAGVVLSAWGLWTFVAWIADGPAPVTGFEDRSSASWIGARVFEVIYVLMSIAVVTFVVRGVRRERRFTFDAMFVVAGFSALWVDPMVNMFGPFFLYTSNWVNLNTWCGYTPGVVNPVCSQMPEPVGNLLVYTFGLLAFTLILNGALAWMRRRNPGLTTRQLIVRMLLVSLAVEIPFEGLMARLWIWVYPGSPNWMSLTGGQHRLPLLEILGGLVVFAGMCSVRYFKDDRGRSFVERGLDHLSPRRQKFVSTMALCGFIQLLFVFDVICVSIAGFYSSPYPKMPAHIVNRICDAPGVEGTAYGPCPSPGFHMPIRTLQ